MPTVRHLPSILLATSMACGVPGTGGDAGTPPQDGATDAGQTDASDFDARARDAGGPDAGLCATGPGTACNPIVIDALPFMHDGDTSTSGEALIDAYVCAPSADERGPEVHYELTLSEPTRIAATVMEMAGVDVDLHFLSSADPATCHARANTDLELGLAAGTHRIIVDTFHSGGTDHAGGYRLEVSGSPPSASSLGTMWNTYYFLANEADHTGAQDTTIYDAGCSPIVDVRRAFHDSVCLEGSGIVLDGRVINYATTCTSTCPAARTCGSASYRICYSVLDPERYPWGSGAGSVALEPDLSIAVDPAFVPLHTSIYLEELDGTVPPGSTTPHDGCVRADDTGGAIDGNHFDFFSGTRARWLEWEAIFPTRSDFTAWMDHPRCYARGSGG